MRGTTTGARVPPGEEAAGEGEAADEADGAVGAAATAARTADG